MSNLDYDQSDYDIAEDIIIPWAKANGLRPGWILADDVFVEGDVIRFREIIPAPGTEGREVPDGILEPTPEDEFAEKVGEWQTAPLLVHPSLFGLEVKS